MSEVKINRLERWGIPFCDEMTDENVEYLLQMPLFSQGMIDPENFNDRLPLAGILKNDSRLMNCKEGEIIIREGEWGNSAFFLLSGSVRVVIERAQNSIPPELLGQPQRKRKSVLEILKQCFNRSPEIEQRDLASYAPQAYSENSKSSRIYLQDFNHIVDCHKTTRIDAIDFFGEQSALGRLERSATVFADGDCEILEVRWQGIRDLMNKAPWLKTQIDMRFRAYGLYSFLKNSSYFEHLSIDENATEEDHERKRSLSQHVFNHAELRTYGKYDQVDSFLSLVEHGTASNLAHEPLIAREGDYVEGIYIIRSGIARVSHRYNNGHRTISYLTPGHAFGVAEVVESWRDGKPTHLHHSLRAVGYVTVVFIPSAIFELAVLEELFDRQKNKTTYSGLKGSNTPQNTTHLDNGLMEFLVERRFVNGSATMVIDLDRCTRCDDCVRACAATHDQNPRFLRQGPVHDKYMIANACMHCADPVCMIQCPTGAIHRNSLAGEVIVNDLTCIGCGACANNCPYDAIRMVQIRDQNGNLIYPTQTTKRQADGTQVVRKLTPLDPEWQPIEKATKCDLCSDQITGPACQNACPHDALVRLDLGSYETAAQWFKR
ncbi:cyclic nucleotide-binding domain-containing protein [Rubinisphaera italica]|uniref:Hydrogenase-4 component A n=1 Tax=Rubinisphaera italica TaxID=2527969 RepID=A0A5C5XFA3_9PLAN|nr:cyclic nucleotide-binding domain-containing protein [Rubinisphaera italica]TWT61339.1 Hydrogenase-4 component A [Rubinisphaera italica]